MEQFVFDFMQFIDRIGTLKENNGSRPCESFPVDVVECYIVTLC